MINKYLHTIIAFTLIVFSGYFINEDIRVNEEQVYLNPREIYFVSLG